MTRVLYVHSRRNTFTDLDREALAERYEVVDYFQHGLVPHPLKLLKGVRSCDVVFGWFASWHTFAALTLASVMRRPSVLIIGGFDTAKMPEINYGSQLSGIRGWVGRWTIRRATRLITNSNYLVGEIEQNLGIPPSRVRAVYHGVPDRFPEQAEPQPKKRMALTVGAVYSTNLKRKGHGAFAEAAALVPDAEFVLAGGWVDETGERLKAEGRSNLRVTGFLSDEDLDALFRETAVYVQASAHEGFGMSLAEAMLAGAVPVVTRAGALPEVAGDTGVTIESATAEAVAAGVREALELGPEAGRRARRRVLEEFPMEKRRDGICEEVEAALASKRRG